MTDTDRDRPDDHATTAERTARRRRRGHEAQALADAPPGICGGHGTHGGQLRTTGSAQPPTPSRRDTTASPRGSAEPERDDGHR
ncbi:hypothetical protein AB0N17_33010 [Streptomyces sp. NPDC051133]|uniref:hypothetical protein n=1 Tax=Streptomyces sp. NPDC051133 TaxID=3155521 RepID=UPI00341A3F25